MIGRWTALARAAAPITGRLASLGQVHGATVVRHERGWRGWLRVSEADGHVTAVAGTAMTVGIADCIPIFLAHPKGACGILHSGWRGTAARIVEAGVAAMKALGCPANELLVHLGPAICGRCYEVGPDVHAALTGRRPDRPLPVDLRTLAADQARAAGVRRITISDRCTRCDNDRFFSHRAGDTGRQVAVMSATAGAD